MRISRHHDELTCRVAADMVTDHLEGELPKARQRAFIRHLRICPSCALYLAQIRATVNACRRLEPAQLTEDGRRALVERLRNIRK